MSRLLRIQDLALEMRRARELVESAPARIEQIEERFRERNAEYVALQTRFDELEADQRSRNQELADLEEARRKYTDQLMQVKNQREYAAMLKEIDAVKARAAEHEDAVLRDMEESEALRGDLEARTEHIQAEREQVEQERQAVETEAERARGAIERLDAERAAIEAELPVELVETVRRVEEYRQGVFLAKADGQVCQSCFVRIRPQVFQEIKLGTRIHACGNCRRLLYHEPSLRAVSAERSAGAPRELGAVNGGTV